MAGDPDRPSEKPPSTPEGEPDTARVVRWRKRTATFFWGAAAVFSLASSTQVGLQLFKPAEPAAPPPSCAAGIRDLQASLDAGWAEARREDDSPEHALDRFRSAVRPGWRHLPWLQRACRTDPGAATRLDALERLRYALESRVRVDGGSLAALRRRALDASGGGPILNTQAGDPTALPTLGGATVGGGTDEEGPEPIRHLPGYPLPGRPSADPSRNETR